MNNSGMTDFTVRRYQVNNYFEYLRSGRILYHLDRGEEPWDDLTDPANALVSPDNRRIVGSWNRVYGNRSIYDTLEQQQRGIRKYGRRRSRGSGGGSTTASKDF